jgi:hypothetical protein
VTKISTQLILRKSTNFRPPRYCKRSHNTTNSLCLQRKLHAPPRRTSPSAPKSEMVNISHFTHIPPPQWRPRSLAESHFRVHFWVCRVLIRPQESSFSALPESSHPSTIPSSMSPISGPYTLEELIREDWNIYHVHVRGMVHRLTFWVIPVAAKPLLVSPEA